MSSDFNDRSGSPPRPEGQPGVTSGTDFGSGRGSVPGAQTLGQSPDTKPGNLSEPGSGTHVQGRDPSRADDRASAPVGESLHDDRNRFGDAFQREASDARDATHSAAEGIRDQAAGLASSARQRLAEEAEGGKEQASSSLGDFASAIRKASDELGERDQSMAAGVMREVASGIEQAANTIKGSSLQELGQSVAGFARRQPTAFMLGAALAGVALGRLARASGSQSSAGRYDERSGSAGYADRYPGASRSAGADDGSAGSASGADSTVDRTSDVSVGAASTGLAGADEPGDASSRASFTQAFGDRTDVR